MKRILCSSTLFCFLISSTFAADFFLQDAQRVVFLGDSITQDGRYVEIIESWLIQNLPAQRFEVIKLGLSSETVEGLTEPVHPFPRPNIHDRVESALTKSKPDVVVVCYGMNDGIYHPFSDERFAAFQEGMRQLISRIQAAGAKAVLLTPPPFDAVAARSKVVGRDAPQFGYETPYINYDGEVLVPYGTWIRSLRSKTLPVVDVHKPMLERTEVGRKENPRFTLAADGIHPGDEGHWLMARTVLEAWGADQPKMPRVEILKLIHEKWQVLGPAWLSRVGHKRNPPAVNFEAAQKTALEIEAKAREIAKGASR